MPINQVQFQRGLSMAEFMDRYGSEEQCEEVVMTSRWPAGFTCPRCAGTQHSRFRRDGLLYLQCCACRHQCSLIVDTILENTKLSTLPDYVLYSANARMFAGAMRQPGRHSLGFFRQPQTQA